jgi:hypothetical protein
MGYIDENVYVLQKCIQREPVWKRECHIWFIQIKQLYIE